MNLTTVSQALKSILNACEDFGTERIEILSAVDRVLKEDISADRDFPPFNRVSMDGIAIVSSVFERGQRTFEIEGVQAAGSPQMTIKNETHCLEVMTGAMLPEGTDAVIQYELLEIKDGRATINEGTVKYFQNVHAQGMDRKKGDLICTKNTLLSASEIGVLATVGIPKVLVAKQPKVLLISTGDELVDIDTLPQPYQIRKSNVYTLAALLKQLQISSDITHISDDKELLTEKIKSYLNTYDVLLFSGAVSKGKFDFIPDVLADLGVEKLFHRVKQRPGKPFWFGKKGRKTVFAFPGNPVSTFVSCLKYFYPWYRKSIGLKTDEKSAILGEDFCFKPELHYFLQVKLEVSQGKLLAMPSAGKGSGDLANLADSDAFLELPDDKSNFTKGEIFPILTFRTNY